MGSLRETCNTESKATIGLVGVPEGKRKKSKGKKKKKNEEMIAKNISNPGETFTRSSRKL